jgi:glycosyltransferase involved in cell wall biosynthesis
MNFKPALSVVLCTYNNADSLSITLQQLLTQGIAEKHQIEIIIVNNNSNDHTEDICRAAMKTSEIPFHYIIESRQGLSHARNSGVEKASGDYILFTDDDAELPDSWLASYWEQITKNQPDCLYSCIHVQWDKPQPWWYQKKYRPCFVELNYGEKLLAITDIHHEFFGKNFCVKKQFILDQGGFDPALGRMGSKLIAGEETLLYRGLIRSKRKVIYFPDAPVGHRLKPKEYTEAHIKKLFIDGAYSAVHIARVTTNKKIGHRPLGLFVGSIKTLFKSATLFAAHLISGNKQQRFYHSLCVQKSLMTILLWINIHE